MVRETVLTTDDLIWPLFLVAGEGTRIPVESMPGVERLSVDEAVRDAERALALKIPCIALFPYTDPKLRDAEGSEGLNPGHLVCRAGPATPRTHAAASALPSRRPRQPRGPCEGARYAAIHARGTAGC